MQDEKEKLIREASQHKTKENLKWESTQILATSLQVLKLGEEADKLSSVRDYHAAEQCYLQAIKILPQHAQSLCNYAHLLSGIMARKNWTRLKNCIRKLSKQNLTVQQRYSTTLHIFISVDGCERVVTLMQ
jgi:hypothetical protein